MKKNRWIFVPALGAFLMLCLSTPSGYCAERAWPVLDHAGLQALVKETQRESQAAKELGLVWWIPTMYWRASITASDPNAGQEQLEKFEKVLSPYILVAAVQGQIGPLGGIEWTSEERLRSGFALIDKNGKEYRPLPGSAVTPDAKNLIAILRPVIANMLGPMGEHLYFMYFPGATDKKVPIADPLSEGSFAIRMGGETHKWRLPLGALLPKKRCPVDDEIFSGAFTYCPYHGKELMPAAAK